MYEKESSMEDKREDKNLNEAEGRGSGSGEKETRPKSGKSNDFPGCDNRACAIASYIVPAGTYDPRAGCGQRQRDS